MPLTRAFKDTVRARIERDQAFREALLTEALETILDGDLATGQTILRDYINATIGFAALAEATDLPVKSLMRMLGPRGNPRAQNLLAVISHLRKEAGLRFELRPVPVPIQVPV